MEFSQFSEDLGESEAEAEWAFISIYIWNEFNHFTSSKASFVLKDMYDMELCYQSSLFTFIIWISVYGF